jgi:hypothetical protein
MTNWISCEGAGKKPRPGTTQCTECNHVRELRTDGKVRAHKAVGTVDRGEVDIFRNFTPEQRAIAEQRRAEQAARVAAKRAECRL